MYCCVLCIARSKMPLDHKQCCCPNHGETVQQVHGWSRQSDQFTYELSPCPPPNDPLLEDSIYHLIETMVMNAYIFYNWVRMEHGDKRKTETCFRDKLVLDIIRRYGSSAANVDQIQCAYASMIRHRGTLQVDRGKCAWCQSMKSIDVHGL